MVTAADRRATSPSMSTLPPAFLPLPPPPSVRTRDPRHDEHYLITAAQTRSPNDFVEIDFAAKIPASYGTVELVVALLPRGEPLPAGVDRVGSQDDADERLREAWEAHFDLIDVQMDDEGKPDYGDIFMTFEHRCILRVPNDATTFPKECNISQRDYAFDPREGCSEIVQWLRESMDGHDPVVLQPRLEEPGTQPGFEWYDDEDEEEAQ